MGFCDGSDQYPLVEFSAILTIKNAYFEFCNEALCELCVQNASNHMQLLVIFSSLIVCLIVV